MKVALVVNEIRSTREENIAEAIKYIREAANAGADLVLFPETALTGLENNDDPAHDLPLGTPIPGPITDQFCQLAREVEIHIALGIYEVEGGSLYDSAILITPEGEIGLNYRRMSKGWHHPKADPQVYREGTEVLRYQSTLGKVGFLICGDLMQDDLIDQARELELDLLLYPFARSFIDQSYDQERWNTDPEEFPSYIKQVQRAQTLTLMTNYLDQYCFGGAYAIAPTGEVLARFPLGQAGILYVDL